MKTGDKVKLTDGRKGVVVEVGDGRVDVQVGRDVITIRSADLEDGESNVDSGQEE